MNWPKCALCIRQVDAYGLDNETSGSIEVWARCNGVTQGMRVHPELKDSVLILKGPGWSMNRFCDSIRRMAFFHPEGDRRWKQNITQDGVDKR